MEQLVARKGHSLEVMGSIPIPATNIAPWCNGSTTDFGSVSIGSNPIGVTSVNKFLWHFNLGTITD